MSSRNVKIRIQLMSRMFKVFWIWRNVFGTSSQRFLPYQILTDDLLQI